MKTKYILIALVLWTWGVNGQWFGYGPHIGDCHVDALASDSTHIFAGTTDGVFLSTDNGNSWREANSGLEGRNVIYLSFGKSNVYAVTFDGYIFSTPDFGQTWGSISIGGWSDLIGAVIELDNHLFAASGNYGVYHSLDYGITWELKNQGIQINHKPTSFAVSGSVIFTGTTGGVYRSMDYGEHWQQVITGMANTGISALGVCGTYIFAVAYNKSIYRTADNGDLWEEVNIGLTSKDVTSFAPRLGSIMYAGTHSDGVFASTIAQPAWVKLNRELADTNVCALTYTGSRLIAGTAREGIYTRVVGPWVKASTGLPTAHVAAIAVQDTTIFVSTSKWSEYQPQGTLFVSGDDGLTWTERKNGLPAASIAPIAVSGINIFGGTPGDGVFWSSDGGNSWTQQNNGLTRTTIASLAVEDSLVVASTYPNDLFISTNTGSLWHSIAITPYIYVSSVAIRNGAIYAGTEGYGVFMSTDQGSSWTDISSNLGDYFVHVMGVSGDNIFVETDAGVFLTKDNGVSWAQAETGLEEVVVGSFAFNGGNIFAGTSRGIFQSTNNGASWTAENDGFPESGSQWSIVAIKDEKLIASYGYHGVFVNSTLLTSNEQMYSVLPEVRLFPNPAEQSITLETNDVIPEGTLSLYNISGQQVLQKQIANCMTPINICNLPAGMYIVRYSNGQTIRTGRFIKE